jgi:NAD(P)-dependent dehydrogenase (short-subunit alcohol dehydrogenase family)
MNNNDLQKSWLNLDSRVCVLTGAAGGIGARLPPRWFARTPMWCCLIATNKNAASWPPNWRKTVKRMSLCCTAILPILSVQQAAEQVQALHGRCDVLINNASVLQAGALES